MLHYNVVLALLIGAAHAQVPTGTLTVTERAALDRQLSARTVDVRRRTPPPPGFTVPGDAGALYRGWLAVGNRVVTASLATEGWPTGDGDVLEVRGADGAWRVAAVGLMDARVGLAVLDLVLPASAPSPVAEDRALRPGRQLFAAGAGQPIDVRVADRAADPLAWYWRLLGPPLVPGTPLFDGQGGLVTLVGAPGPLALPAEAVQELITRARDWQP